MKSDKAHKSLRDKHRVLTLTSRGLSVRDRHLLKDLRSVMPHQRQDSKLERWSTLTVINEIAELRNCDKALLFEGRRKKDLYMWLANTKGNGPSVKFLVENVNTMNELKLVGNCLKGSTPILSFDQAFNREPHLMLLKELMMQVFGVPKNDPKSQPFIDRIYTFTYLDNRIWFRHYQILSDDAVAEIGPRFVLNPVKIFQNSFTGATLWENPKYITPSKYRSMVKRAKKSMI